MHWVERQGSSHVVKLGVSDSIFSVSEDRQFYTKV